MGNVKWEYFLDPGYYDMWCVRPVGDKDFNSPRNFHIASRVEAEALTDLLNKCICGVNNELL
jgi:hypothetical protein